MNREAINGFLAGDSDVKVHGLGSAREAIKLLVDERDAAIKQLDEALAALGVEAKKTYAEKRETHTALLNLAAMEDQRDRALALLRDNGDSRRSYCSIVEYPANVKVDECAWELPCWEHRRRALLAEVGG